MEWWGTLLFIFWLDSLIPPLEWGMGFRPALLGLFVVIWGFRRGPQEGAILGLVIGLIGALFVGRAIAGHVSGAAAFDPVVFASIFGVLAVAGTLASLLPALRAIRIAPAVALRYE